MTIRIAQPHRDAPSSDWTVYADALQEANDPRGELIVLNQAVAKGMAPADRDAYVANHRDALFGSAAKQFAAFRVTWIGCLVDAVEILIGPAELAERVMIAFLGSPLALTARSIALVGLPQRDAIDLEPVVAMLIERWPAACRALALVDQRATETTMLASRDFDPDGNLVTFGPLGGVWKHVEHIRIEVADSHQLDLGTIDAPELRSFALRSLRYATGYGGDSPISAVLAAARWPKLTSFELRIPEEFMANIIADEHAYVPKYFATHREGDDDDDDGEGSRYDEAENGENTEGANWTQLVPVLTNLANCPLERLALTSFDSADSLLEALGSAGLPSTLVELDLSDSSIASIDWFVANKARLFSLKRLVLEDTRISGADANRLAELGPAIKHSSGGGAKYRYVVGSE